MKIRLVSKGNYKEVKKFQKEFAIANDGDICIAIGGDGTFVRTAREYDGPMLLVHSKEKGSLGYYADVDLDDTDFIISSIKNGKYSVENLGRKLEISFKGKTFHAINEVVLHREKDAIHFKVYTIRDGKKELLYPYVISGDGVIVSSSIGSTAYNRMAGGPILMNADDVCITFLSCGPFENSIVLGNREQLYIEVAKGKGNLSYDNADIGAIESGEGFYVKASEKHVRIIRLDKKGKSVSEKMKSLVENNLIKAEYFVKD